MPVQFSQNDLVRSLLIRFLQRPDTEYEHKLDIQHYSTSIELPILFREYDRFGNTLTKTAIMNINQTIQDIVEEALYNYIQLHHIIGGQLLKNVIPMFRAQYGFPEESYSTEAMNKFWQRENKRRIKAKNISAETVLPQKTIIKITPSFAQT